MKTNNLEVGKCINCKRLWESKKLKEVTFLTPLGDGFVRRKQFICLDCFYSINEGLKYQKTQLEKDL